MAKRKKQKRDLHLGHYAVAFIDLLGQQEFLRSLSLPIPGTPENIEATKGQLANTYGAVTRMRKWFDDSFVTYARRNIDHSGLTPEQRKEFKTLTNNPIKYQAFSDSIVIFMPLRTNTAKLPIRGIFGILGAAATTFGYLILDHLGEHYRQTFGEAIDATVVKNAYEQVLKFDEMYKDDEKLASRYKRLKNYFESRMPIWDDLIPF